MTANHSGGSIVTEPTGSPPTPPRETAHGDPVPASLGELPDRSQPGKNRTLRRALRDPVLLVSGAITLGFVLAGLMAPVLAPHPYEQQDLINSFAPPLTEGHLLGTDQLGRDMLSRLMYGVRTSLYVSGVVTVISLIVGMAVGLIAGYFGGRVDRFASAVIDIAWGLPIILIAIAVVAILGPGVGSILIGIAIVNWAGFARIIRGEVLSLREREFIEAARTSGAGTGRILVRHIMPNTLPPTIVMASFYMGIVIMAEASLSFIGLGAQPPLPSLGQMVEEGKAYMFHDFRLILIPGVILAVIVLCFNQFGDSLRDLLDPRLQR